MAIKQLHAVNIIHRDIKADNIFTTKSNMMKLGDLGMAHKLQKKTSMVNDRAGTPYHMSPE